MVQLAPEKWQASRDHVPSLLIHNQSVVHLEGQTCPPPSITAFANGLFVHAMDVSIQRGAFFLTVEEQKEAVSVVSRSLRVALSSPGLNKVSRCPFE